MLMRRVPALMILLLAFCLGAAANNARIVRLSMAQGEVELDRNVGQGIEHAIVNTPITSGMRLDTYDGARAEVEFENGGTIRLVGRASVTFRELSMNANGDKITAIDVQHGTVYFDIHHKGDDRFQVSVLGQDVNLDKSAHLRIIADEQTATVAVFKGEAWLDGRGERAAVKKNETLTLESNDPGRYFLAKNIDSLADDQWDRSRSTERDQYASNSGYQYSNTAYGAPYSYGVNDMLQYGNYFNDPGYGWLWRPSMFDASWDPFSSGMWSYYPGAGYVFISQYPWGWTPYRYGRWVFLNGRGWCWSPRGGYSNWNVMPVVIHPPRGFVPLNRPRGNGGPALFVNDRRLPPSPDPRHYVRRRLPGDESPRNAGGMPPKDNADHYTRDRGRLPGTPGNGKLPAAGVPSPAPTAIVTPHKPAPREPVPDTPDAWRGEPSKGRESWRHPAPERPMPAEGVVRPGKNPERDVDRRVDRSAPPTPAPQVRRESPAPQQPVPERIAPAPAPRVEREHPAPQQPVRVEPAPAPQSAPRMETPRSAPQSSPRTSFAPRATSSGMGAARSSGSAGMSHTGGSGSRGEGGHRGR